MSGLSNTNDARSFVKSLFQFSIGQWIAAFITFITTPIITWLIIPNEFGKAAMFTLAFNLILNIVLLGADQSFVRFFYERKEIKRRDLLWESLLPSLILGIITFIIIGIFWQELSFLLFGDANHFTPILLLDLTIFVAIIERYAMLLVRMKQRGKAYSMIKVINSLANAIFTILYALLVAKTFYAVIIGLFFSHVFSATVAIIYEKDIWFGKFKINLNSIKSIINYGLPFVPTAVIIWIFQSIDRIAIRNYCDFAEVGLYSAAFKIVAVMSLLQNSFANYWVPVSYETYEKNPNNTAFFEKISLFISAIMFACGMLLVIFKDVIFLLLESSYRGAAGLTAFLILMPIMDTVAYVTTIGINFKKKTYLYIIRAVISATLNVIGNIILVPKYGAEGAALSTGISYVVYFFIGTYYSQKLYPVDYHLNKFYTCAFIFLIVAFINTFVPYLLLQIISAIIGLIIVLFVYKEQIIYLFNFSKNEFIRLKSKKRY
ncbi:MAG: oligosaccharide flippase family protein [Bacteroidales bacterium]|jgi:O-antigen/teichoic acid export membrane protein|nr:oligosaccharide flippase family protein [Bacteroidales bacterium]MDI9574879.1 oligosaccharide flippase family protein [Bacteroidota bacterium]MDD3756114.1 oligosaccharide flippase family protein [Bacteroidales bacterium]MDY0401320.1 oligosaccharide flippase family protein [Bacteroidales bacterium]HHW58909.1 oligosaccharide flippase family protein [Bacteroidales bacterium]